MSLSTSVHSSYKNMDASMSVSSQQQASRLTVVSDAYCPPQNNNQYSQCYRFNKPVRVYADRSNTNPCISCIIHLKVRGATLFTADFVSSHVDLMNWEELGLEETILRFEVNWQRSITVGN